MKKQMASEEKKIASPWYNYVLGNLAVIGLIDIVLVAAIYAIDKPKYGQVLSMGALIAAWILSLLVTMVYLAVACLIRLPVSKNRDDTTTQFGVGAIAMVILIFTLMFLVSGLPQPWFTMALLEDILTSLALFAFIAKS